MPATIRGNRSVRTAIGVDGCRLGWLTVARNLLTGEFAVAIADSFRSFLDAHSGPATSIIVDMPIGLPDAGRRACEAEARQRIGARRSSVFTPPLRPLLHCRDYREANQRGKENGRGLSRQSWGIVPKIREVDAALSPNMQSTIAEGHPEVAFTRLGGDRPCRHPKRTREGEAERKAILIAAGLRDIDDALNDLRRRHPWKKEFGNDDFYDACALSLTAEHRFTGTAWRLGGDARDTRGLLMEIWG